MLAKEYLGRYETEWNGGSGRDGGGKEKSIRGPIDGQLFHMNESWRKILLSLSSLLAHGPIDTDGLSGLHRTFHSMAGRECGKRVSSWCVLLLTLLAGNRTKTSFTTDRHIYVRSSSTGWFNQLGWSLYLYTFQKSCKHSTLKFDLEQQVHWRKHPFSPDNEACTRKTISVCIPAIIANPSKPWKDLNEKNKQNTKKTSVCPWKGIGKESGELRDAWWTLLRYGIEFSFIFTVFFTQAKKRPLAFQALRNFNFLLMWMASKKEGRGKDCVSWDEITRKVFWLREKWFKKKESTEKLRN